jgi:nitric oxide synthase-interacting protein
MGKHSKNNNDRAFFSHAERQAAAYGRHSSSMLGGHNTAGGNFVDRGWGTQKRTLDSDAMKDLDACSLTLVPCVEPVITLKGVIYDKQVRFKPVSSPRPALWFGSTTDVTLSLPPLCCR